MLLAPGQYLTHIHIIDLNYLFGNSIRIIITVIFFYHPSH